MQLYEIFNIIEQVHYGLYGCRIMRTESQESPGGYRHIIMFTELVIYFDYGYSKPPRISKGPGY